MFTPERITVLAPHEIFVFGSNLAGIHGAGAAKYAKNFFGAKQGVGVGFTGMCYAIPTKDKRLKVLSLKVIKVFVEGFLYHANLHPELIFLVTPIGCGLAGYTPNQIAPMFMGVPENVVLPMSFHAEIVNTLSKP